MVLDGRGDGRGGTEGGGGTCWVSDGNEEEGLGGRGGGGTQSGVPVTTPKMLKVGDRN